MRQQLQGAVERAVAEDGWVQLGCARRGLRRDYRPRRDGGRGGGLGKRDDGVGLALDGFDAGGIQPQAGVEIVQEAPFGLAGVAVGLARADRRFIGELAMPGLGEGGGALQAGALERHVLVEPHQVGRARVGGQGVGDAADFLAFAGVLLAVGKGGERRQGEDGGLLFGVRVDDASQIWVISRATPTRATVAQPRRST